VAQESDLGQKRGRGLTGEALSTAVGGWPKEIGVEGVVSGRWRLIDDSGRWPEYGQSLGWCRRSRGTAGGASQHEVPVADEEGGDELALGRFFTTQQL
jgi:hypothetical protein